MKQKLAASELVLNSDGSVYHCNLHNENLANIVFLVGDPDRVPLVSAYFDKIDFKTQKREIVTHTGQIAGKRVTVLSTGMGTDNIDIVLNELDAVANIDIKNKTLKEQRRQLTFIRMGTSGSLQPEILVDSFLASQYGLGFDGLTHYYAGANQLTKNAYIDKFIEKTDWNEYLPRPYLAPADSFLFEKAKSLNVFHGVTATATGFYGPQGRVLRLALSQENLNEKLRDFEYDNLKITNFEMETSAIYGLAYLMGHRALTVNCIVANRFTGEFSKDSHSSIIKLVEKMLFEFLPQIDG
jgi:uridine phosphorylase